jgi:ribonuclease HI
MPFFSPVLDPERVELLICRQALKLAQEMGLRRVFLETDCANTIAKMKGTHKDRSIRGPLMEEIKVLL